MYKIEIYGIPETLHKCFGCISAKKYLDNNRLQYKFHNILIKDNTDLGFKYDTNVINELKARTRKRKPPTNYPQIFVNDNLIGGFNAIKEYFTRLGYDE